MADELISDGRLHVIAAHQKYCLNNGFPWCNSCGAPTKNCRYLHESRTSVKVAPMMTNEEAAHITLEQSGHESIVHTDCDNPYCMVCVGGLFACERCGGFGWAITTHCPGTAITEDQLHTIYRGVLDYRDGQWTSEGSPHSPSRR